MKTLETDRLILRDWAETDLGDFYEYAQVEGVGELAGWRHHENIDVSRRILQVFLDKRETYAIVHKETGKVIGSVGITADSKDPLYRACRQKKIGYVLSKDYWGQGLMTEAMRAVIPYVFDELASDVIWIGHFLFNDRSRRVIEKCGFRYYGDGVFEAKTLGKSFDERIYLLTKDDWKSALSH